MTGYDYDPLPNVRLSESWSLAIVTRLVAANHFRGDRVTVLMKQNIKFPKLVL
jgi:hypothetical protein